MKRGRERRRQERCAAYHNAIREGAFVDVVNANAKTLKFEQSGFS